MAAILIVEDDRLVAGQMARTLREAGHTPILAHDAHTALQKALDRPDAILLDLGLPELPGEELLQRLKSRPETAEIPVLVVTGKQEAAVQLRNTGQSGVASRDSGVAQALRRVATPLIHRPIGSLCSWQ